MKIGLVLILWIIAAVFAIGNGFVGESFVASRLGDYGVHVYKSISMIIFIFLIAWIFAQQTVGTGWLRSAGVAGLSWLGLTIIFEFMFGHFVLGISWHVLLKDYNFTQGRLWSLVLVSVLCGPFIMGSRLNR